VQVSRTSRARARRSHRRGSYVAPRRATSRLQSSEESLPRQFVRTAIECWVLLRNGVGTPADTRSALSTLGVFMQVLTPLSIAAVSPLIIPLQLFTSLPAPLLMLGFAPAAYCVGFAASCLIAYCVVATASSKTDVAPLASAHTRLLAVTRSVPVVAGGLAIPFYFVLYELGR
jgi:hypothetical protein